MQIAVIVLNYIARLTSLDCLGTLAPHVGLGLTRFRAHLQT
jgi:hypothetical protein